jgi:ribosomal protein S15P/S13E
MNKKVVFIISSSILIISLCVIYFEIKTINEPPSSTVGSLRSIPPSIKTPSLPEQLPQQKQRIQPIVIKEEDIFNKKPVSLEPEDWDAYNRNLLEKIHSETSPGLRDKLIAERQERDSPDTEENLARLQEEIEKLREKLAADPSDAQTKETLMKLLNIQSKFKYLQELFSESE